MDRSPETNRVANASSSSPSVQESPFSNFLRNLTPIDTAKNESYAQRLLGGTLPTPPVVFTSPHVSLHRETSYLERNDIVEAGSNVDVYKQCNTTIVQNPRFEKEVQLCSASGCIDEYLSYPEEVDSINSTDLLLQPANEVSQLLHGGINTSKEVHSVIDGSTKNEALTSLDHAEEFPTSSTMKGNESTIDKNLMSQAQSRDQKKAKFQSAGNQDQGEENAIIQSSEDLNKRKGKVPKASVKKVSQHHRGIRRHLQFETSSVAHENINAKILCGVKHDTANLQSSSNLLNSKSLASFDFDNKDSSSTQTLNRDNSQLYSCPYVSARPSQIGRTSSTSTPICSGPGLHLNRIAISTSTSSDMFLSKKSTGYLSTPAQMFDRDYKNNIQKDTSGCFISAVPGEIFSSVGHGQQKSHTAADTSSFTFHCTDQIQIDQLPVPGEGNASQDAGKVDELNHLSQKGKRRRSADISESCKRCNCKKSKCLKLYCECFAAGVFCLDSCSCENCYNKPEFEDTVFDARQQIESRNPLAFAPKVLKHEINAPANFLDEGNWATPSSARHKRGCNCKKSKCLKRYCECFQAKVQCSSACRCDGCQNPYGTKAEHEYNRSEKCESHPVKTLDTIKGEDDCTKATNISQYSPSWDGLSAISNLTPVSNPCSSMKVSSASSSMISCQKTSQAQLQSSGLQPSSTGQFKWGCTPVTFTPQVYEIKGNYQLSADGTSCERMDDDTPEMLKETSNPVKVVKANSPNQKRISPPQSRAQRSSSRSPTGLKSGRKFVLQAMPSFPPLSPYSDAKDAISDTRNGRKGTKN